LREVLGLATNISSQSEGRLREIPGEPVPEPKILVNLNILESPVWRFIGNFHSGFEPKIGKMVARLRSSDLRYFWGLAKANTAIQNSP
jgi:hypothetical protein